MAKWRPSQFLSTYRKRLGLSQREVSILLGRESSSRLSRFEAGEREPSLKAALALALIYGTTVEDLYSGLLLELREEIEGRATELLAVVDEESPRSERKRQALRLLAAKCKEL